MRWKKQQDWNDSPLQHFTVQGWTKFAVAAVAAGLQRAVAVARSLVKQY